MKSPTELLLQVAHSQLSPATSFALGLGLGIATCPALSVLSVHGQVPTEGCVCTGAQASAGKSVFLAVPGFFWELLVQGWAEVPQSSCKIKAWGVGCWRGIVDTGSLPKHTHGCATGWAGETIPA